MKKLLILPLLLLSLSSLSQIPDYFGNNPSWLMHMFKADMGGHSHNTFILQFDSSETINGIEYQRLMHKDLNGNNVGLDCYLRQDGKKIYGIFPGYQMNSDTLCIDYNVTIGDTLKGWWASKYLNEWVNPLRVDSISNYTHLGETRKVYHIYHYGNGNYESIIVEGVGFFGGGLYHDMVETIPGGYITILCHSINGQTYWVADSAVGCDSAYSLLENELKFKSYPNPSTGLIKIEGTDLFNSKFQVLDLQGRIIPFTLSIINNEMAEIEVLLKGLFLLQLSTDKGSKSELIKIE